jgi:hypothetical protein
MAQNLTNDPSFLEYMKQQNNPSAQYGLNVPQSPQVGPTIANQQQTAAQVNGTPPPLSAAQFPTLNQIGQQTAMEVNRPPLSGVAEIPNLNTFDSLADEPFSPNVTNPVANLGTPAVTPMVGGDGQITSANEPSSFMAGLNQKAGLPSLDMTADQTTTPAPVTAQVPQIAPPSATPTPSTGLPQGFGPVTSANIAAGRPANVSAGTVQVAQREAMQREAEMAADRAAKAFEDQIGYAGRPIAETDKMVAAYRANVLNEAMGKIEQPEIATPAPAAKLSATGEKIALIKEANPNISDADASAIASGSVKVVQNPLTGETQLLNVATGESRKIEAQQAGEDFDIAAPEKTLFSRAGEFTGAVEAAKRKAQGITGQIGLDVATDESLEAAQDFETAQNALVRAFRESDRYAATEANQLKKELNISLSPFEDPKSAEAKLRSIDNSLATRYENEIATFEDTNSNPKKRQDARNRARAIATFRAALGVPEDGEASTTGEAPQGVDPADWEYMNEEQRKLWNQ